MDAQELRRRASSVAAIFKDDRVFGLTLFFAALVPRIVIAVATRGAAVWDGHYYAFGAYRIADGFGYSDDIAAGGELRWHPWCHYPVGYSGFLALMLSIARVLFRPFGSLDDSPFLSLVFPLANALTGALLAVVTWLLAKTELSSTRSRIAGLLVAFHPGLLLYAGLVMSEPLAALLVMVSFLLAARARSLGGLAIAGVVLGLDVLVRPQALLCLPFLPIPFLFHRPVEQQTWRSQLKRFATGLLVVIPAAFLPILPWTLRNCAVMDSCALVSTNAGWNLAIGSSPHATGRFDSLRSEDGCRDVSGQVEQDRCWWKVGVANIEKAPGRWFGLMPAKWSQTFDHESFPIEYLREAGRPSGWTEERRVFGRELLTLAHRLLLLAAALGGVAFVRSGRGVRVQLALITAIVGLFVVGVASTPGFAWPLAWCAAILPWFSLPLSGRRLPGAPAVGGATLLASGLLVTTLVTHALFFGEDRYHMFVVPAFALFGSSLLRSKANLPVAS